MPKSIATLEPINQTMAANGTPRHSQLLPPDPATADRMLSLCPTGV